MRGRLCLTFTLRRYKETEQEERNIFPNFSRTLRYQTEGCNFSIRRETTRAKDRTFLSMLTSLVVNKINPS